MTWVVTGGAGMIGSAFLSKLNNEGINEILVVDDLGESEKWKNLRGKRFIDCIPSAEFREHILKQGLSAYGAISHCIHLGATSSTTVRDASLLLDNNSRFTRDIATASIARNVRFIYASSAATYGDGSFGFDDDEALIFDLRPQNMYGYSKQLFDEWALLSGMLKQIVGIKFFNVFGPNEYHKGEQRSLVNKAYYELITTGKISLLRSYHPDYKDGESVRDFIYLKDILEPLWWLAEHPEVNGIFNFGTGEARSWNDLARALFKCTGKKEQIEYIEMPETMRDRYQYFTEARMEKLKATGCPWKTRPLEEAVSDYIKNYLEGEVGYF